MHNIVAKYDSEFFIDFSAVSYALWSDRSQLLTLSFANGSELQLTGDAAKQAVDVLRSRCPGKERMVSLNEVLLGLQDSLYRFKEAKTKIVPKEDAL